jgi:hypothetical protein
MRQMESIAKKMTEASNAELIEIIRANRPKMSEYREILDAVDEPTADRIAYAMDINRCELTGDMEHKYAPGAPKAWREHN